MNGICLRCGHDGPIHVHHPTGRRDGRPYHPELTTTVCAECHRAEHRIWGRAGLNQVTGIPTILRRLALWLGRLASDLPAEHGQSPGPGSRGPRRQARTRWPMTNGPIRFRGHPVADPKAIPARYGPIPDRFVVWYASLDEHGEIEVGCILEVVEGTVTSETLVHPSPVPPTVLAEYVAAHPAGVNPGGNRTIQLMDRAAAGRLLRSRSYKSGDALVTADLGPQLTALAEQWAPGNLNTKTGTRADWSMVLAGLGYWKAGRYHRYSNEPRLLMTNVGDGVCAAWGRGRPEAALLAPQGGPIVDVLNVATALSGQGMSLDASLQAFDLPAVDTSAGNIHAVRATAAANARLWQVLRAELLRLDYGLNPAWLVSSGAIASAMLRDAGLTPLASRFGLPDRIRGAAAAAFHGGWFEANIVHSPIPSVLADVASTYPRIFSNLDLTRHLSAATVELVDNTDSVRHLLTQPDLADAVYDRQLWRQLGVTLVKVRPRGNRLPIKIPSRSLVASLDLGGDACWWHWPDVVAATLLDGEAPEVLEAVQLMPCGLLPGLRPVILPTGRTVDLAVEDLALAVIDERTRVATDPGLSCATRRRLGLLLKLVGNAVCYGVLARTDRSQVALKVRDQTVAPDGSILAARHGGTVEQPGPWTSLALAGAVCAGARLILAATIAALEDLGGSWLHCAADSLLIAATHDPEPQLVPCPGGPHHPDGCDAVSALPVETLEALLDRFDALLCPDGGRAWKREDGWDQGLVAVVSGVNRHGLINPATGATFHVTEVGLGGTFIDPTGTGQRTPDGHFTWATALHASYLHRQVIGPKPFPAFAGRPALRPGRITTADQLTRLESHLGHRLRPYTAWVLVHDIKGTDLYAEAFPIDPVDKAGWCRHGKPITGPPLKPLNDELIAWTGGLRPHQGLVPPCHITTRLAVAEVIGKEWDTIRDHQTNPEPDRTDHNLLTFYLPVDTWTPLVEAAKPFGAARLAAASGLAPSTVRHLLKGRQPSPSSAEAIRQAVVSILNDTLANPDEVCRLPGCGRQVRRRRKWCSDRCRKTAERAQQRLAFIPTEQRPGLWVWHCPEHGPIESSTPTCPDCGDRPTRRRRRASRDFICPDCGANCGPGTTHCYICESETP